MPELTPDDLNRKIKLLTQRMDILEKRDVDLHGRRVRNASDAELPTDYVTQRQLTKAVNDIVIPTFKVENRQATVHWEITSPAVGDDVTIHPVFDSFYSERATPVRAGARVKTAPTGGVAEFRIDHVSKATGTQTDIFNGSLLTIADGEFDGIFVDLLDHIRFAREDYFILDIVTLNGASELYVYLTLRLE